MPSLPATFAEDVIDLPARAQFEAFLDEHRTGLNGCLDGLTEEQARRSLVPSRTTLLGLVKHATFVEKVWFDEAVTCRSRAEIGIPAVSGESFVLDDDETIASVRRQVGKGRVFYFRPGHETFPVFLQAEPLRIVENAARWLAQP